MRTGVRLRTVLLLVGLVATVVAAGLVAFVTLTTVRARLEGRIGAELLDAILRDAAAGALAAACLAFLVLAPILLWLARRLAHPLHRLRAATVRLADAETSVPEVGGIAEIHALATALAELGEAYRRALAPLTRERDELARLIDSVGEGIVQVDGGGRAVRANRTARAMLGLPAEVAGRPLAVLLRNAELRHALESAARGEAVRSFEIAQDDRRILVIAHALGEPAGAVGVLVDITEIRRLEGVRRDFVANASHELKTPLTSIRGYTETLLGDDLPDETRRDFLETVRQNAIRLQRIVDDLLDLSRIESGGWKPDFHDVDLASAASEAWHALQDRAAEKQIRFQVDVACDPVLPADPVAIRQIYANLLENAIRYTAPGGSVSVRIRREEPEEATATRRRALRHPIVGNPFLARTGQPPEPPAAWVVVEVADTGTGIPGDALPRIFERFYRVDTARSRAEGGTGLGLAIVKHLVESMGGEIAAESTLGRGTTMRFRLPVREDANPEPQALHRYNAVTGP